MDPSSQQAEKRKQIALRREKGIQEMDPSSQQAEKRKQIALRREKGALQHPNQNRTDNIEVELSEKWPQKIKEKKRKKLYRKGALQKCLKKISTQLLRTNSLEKCLKKAHSEERRELSNTLNRTEQNNAEQQLSEKLPQKRKGKKRNTLTRRSPTKVV